MYDLYYSTTTTQEIYIINTIPTWKFLCHRKRWTNLINIDSKKVKHN